MRIVHIVYSLVPDCYRGGIPKAVFELAVAQARLGHQVTVYTTNYNSDQKFTLTARNRVLERDGVCIRYFNAYKFGVFFSPALYRTLQQNAHQFDVIHAHSVFHPLNHYADRVGKRFGLPVFYNIQGSLDPKVIRKGFLKMLKKVVYLQLFEIPALNRAAGIFALSEDEVQQISILTRHVPLHIVPNGINLPTIQTKPVSPFVKLLFIGRIHPKKGLHHLLAALRKVIEVFENVRLFIGGDRQQNPGYTRQLDDYIEKYGLAPYITWLGYLDENSKYIQLAEADIFCHLSESEGMALAILESMSAEVATLVSKGCYMSEAIENKALWECDPTDTEHVAALLLKLIQAPHIRTDLGKNARQYIAKHHAWNHIAATSVEIYQTKRN